jgi:hypothetical protein
MTTDEVRVWQTPCGGFFLATVGACARCDRPFGLCVLVEVLVGRRYHTFTFCPSCLVEFLRTFR